MEHEHDGHSHGGHGGAHDEHASVDALIPTQTATHVAVKNGDWFDPGTWSNGEVPGDGAIVYIPAGRMVDYDGPSNAEIFAIRVDGHLKVDADKGGTTKLIVDTVVTGMGSKLEIDASEAADGEVDIEIRPFDIEAHKDAGAPGWNAAAKSHYSDGAMVMDTGAGTISHANAERLDDGAGVLGRYNWDPEQLSLGIVSMGDLTIKGQEKNPHSMAQTMKKGDTQLTLAETPDGWEVGDTIVITGTQFVGRGPDGENLGSQDEIRTITKIDGNKVSFAPPLQYDHEANDDHGVCPYVANMTRNVEIGSSNDLSIEGVLSADEASAQATTNGHIMSMGGHAELNNAVLDDLGRTDKTKPVDDYLKEGIDKANAERVLDENGDPIETAVNEITNQRGRYAFHLHLKGEDEDGDGDQIEGAVVTGGPGWGLVQHGTEADFVHNVTYGVLGSAFVAEDGAETGLWGWNLAINTYGAEFDSRELDPNDEFKYNGTTFNITAGEKSAGWKNSDFGHYGTGYWMQGKLIDMVDNISTSSGHVGYYYLFRGADLGVNTPDQLSEPLAINDGEAHPMEPGLNIFTGNVSMADDTALVMMGVGGGRINDERSVIDDFTALEVGYQGTRVDYYNAYTIKNSTFIASDAPGVKPGGGVYTGNVVLDLVLADLEIEGFQRDYKLAQSWSGGTFNQHGFGRPSKVSENAIDQGLEDPLPLGHARVLIDPGFSEDAVNASQNADGTFEVGRDVFLTEEDLHVGRFRIVFDDDSLKVDLSLQDVRYGKGPQDPARPSLSEGHVLKLEGIKIDSIGSIPIDYHNSEMVWMPEGVQARLESAGYWVMANGVNAVMLESVFSDRYTGEKYVVSYMAELDPDWDLSGIRSNGAYDSSAFPNVYVANPMLSETGKSLFEREFTTDVAQVAPNSGDTFEATMLGESVYGSIQDDDLLGRGGHDVIYGGEGDDLLAGQNGRDTVYGGDGDDLVRGNKGDDFLFGGDGNDTLRGHAGSDLLSGERGDDLLIAEGGDDELWGGAGADRIRGGDGDDTAFGGAGVDTINGNDGRDALFGGDGDDRLIGGRGADMLQGQVGADRLEGEGGDDRLDGGGGADDLRGGEGADTLIGGTQNDELYGQEGFDTLRGGDGEDRLDGGSGWDVLIGGRGDDVLIGRAGRDVFVMEASFKGGDDEIVDFNVAEDAINLRGGLTVDNITDTSRGALVEISDGSTFLLRDVEESELRADTFQFADDFQF